MFYQIIIFTCDIIEVMKETSQYDVLYPVGI